MEEDEMSMTARFSLCPNLLQLLGISVPIVQAPMAGISTPAMAAAVSEAGGLGSLGIGALGAEAARKAIRDTRALSAKPFNANLLCHTPTIDDAMFRMLQEEKPAVVSFHGGVPDTQKITSLRSAGIVLLATVTSLEEARRCETAGIQALVAQGIEAGGQRGTFDPDGYDEGLGTMALVRLLVRNSTLPVIAAGGIMDGAGIAAALALGAQAAQLGTAFIACPESAADPSYRAALSKGHPRHTTLTRANSGRPARGFVNQAAEPSAQWAGQAVPLARSLPAAQLLRVLQDEMVESINRLALLPATTSLVE
jgi:nitronate monooxygenase